PAWSTWSFCPLSRGQRGSNRPIRATTPPPVAQVKSLSGVGDAPTRGRNRPPPPHPVPGTPARGGGHHENPTRRPCPGPGTKPCSGCGDRGETPGHSWGAPLTATPAPRADEHVWGRT